MNTNFENKSDQAAWDIFGTEILPGDEIVIDNITGETILKENLERYLTESKNYHFITAT